MFYLPKKKKTIIRRIIKDEQSLYTHVRALNVLRISFCFGKVLRNWVGLPVVFSHKRKQGVKNALIRVLSQSFTCPTTLNPTTKGLKILYCYEFWLQKIHDVIVVTLVLSKVNHMR